MINQAILDRFDDDAWDVTVCSRRAPVPGRPGDVAALRRGRARVEPLHDPAAPLQPQHAAVRRVLRCRGFGWTPFRRGQADCGLDRGSDCIVCLGGCPRDSKQNALGDDAPSGTGAGPADLVRGRGPAPRHRGAWSGSSAPAMMPRSRSRPRGSSCPPAPGNAADPAAVGPGDLACRPWGEGSPAIPGSSSMACSTSRWTVHKGAFQAVRSDDPGFRRQGIKFESNFAPPIATAMLLPGSGRPHLGLMKGYRNLASMEVAIRDEPTGRLRLGAGASS